MIDVKKKKMMLTSHHSPFTIQAKLLIFNLGVFVFWNIWDNLNMLNLVEVQILNQHNQLHAFVNLGVNKREQNY